MYLNLNYVCMTIGIIGSIIILYVLQKIVGFLYLKFRNLLRSFTFLEITNVKQCQEACAQLKSHCQDLSALGFSYERKILNGKQRPVASLQLASTHSLCCLFKLNTLGCIPNELEEILCDTNIIKVGFFTINLLKYLNEDYKVQIRSSLNLNTLYTHEILFSLASSVTCEISKSIYFPKKYMEKNSDLTKNDQNHAPMDAFVMLEIFKKWILTNSGINCHPKIIKNFNLFFNEDLKKSISANLRDFKPEVSSKDLLKFNRTPESDNSESMAPKKTKSLYVPRKTPLYDNCFLHAPDGELLTSCDRRKAHWYVQRGLAEVLMENPYSVQLLFKPAARPCKSNESRFYQQVKINRCVVCGVQESFLKHNVVPREYRKYFPKEMKEHHSHDVVLMCLRCHQTASKYNDLLKQELQIICEVSKPGAKFTLLKEAVKIKNCAKALLRAGNLIPIKRKEHLESELKRHFKVDEVTPQLVHKASSIKTKIINKNYEPHGNAVVNYFINKEGGLLKLEKLWREYFLKTMKPRYLPTLWSVTHNRFKTGIVDSTTTTKTARSS